MEKFNSKAIKIAIFGCINVFLLNYSFSHPLLNVNSEDRFVYDVFESSINAKYFITSIRPYNYKKAFLITDKSEWVKEYLNALSNPGFFIKPLNSITFKFLFTSEEYFTLENSSGTLLREGLNFYTFLDGYISFGNRSVIYYQLRFLNNKQTSKAQIHKLYWKIRVWKFSFEVGKDTVHLGPGEYALLLSSNAEPFPMIKFQTEEPLKFFGDWEFVFLRGWLNEERLDRDNPNILALRVVWKPWYFIEIGATRTALYGGEGRPGYKLTEYPKLIIGTEENIPYSKYDSDGYGAIDVSLYLPLNKWFKSVETFKVYYQDSGTDITAWWQKEDKGEFKPPFGFQFLDRGTVAGILVRTKKDIIRFEYTRISRDHYIHHLYNVEGYTYKGMSLGHPYGRNLKHFMFKHRRFLKDKLSIEYKLGYYKQPAFESEKFMERYYVSLAGEKRYKNLILEGLLRFDFIKNYDSNPSPVQFNIINENKTFITVGTSISWRF